MLILLENGIITADASRQKKEFQSPKTTHHTCAISGKGYEIAMTKSSDDPISGVLHSVGGKT